MNKSGYQKKLENNKDLGQVQKIGKAKSFPEIISKKKKKRG